MLKIKVIRDGPLSFNGRFTYRDEQDVSRKLGCVPLSLCRCGKTSSIPFCDRSHISFLFTTDDHLNVEYKIRNENIAPLDGAVLVKAIAGGPFYITGSVSIGDENLAIWEGDQVKLCRCGYSQMKPFCDGAHKNKHPAGGG